MASEIGRYNIILELVSQNENLKKGVNEVRREMGSLNGIFKTAQRAFIAIFAVNTIRNAITAIGETTAKYQQYNTILTNTLQSQEAANEAFDMIKTVARDSVFSVDELTSSYIKFVNRGVQPTADQIVSLTDLAASQGKSFDQLTEAVLDAQTGEFERLKEFGIRASKEGEVVQLAFRGQTVEVQNTADAINEALVGFGQLPGVIGSNAVQMDTINGRISRLRDSLDEVVVQIGTFLIPVFNFFLDAGARALTVVGNLITRFVDFAKESELLEGILTFLARTGAFLANQFEFFASVFISLLDLIRNSDSQFFRPFVQGFQGLVALLTNLPAILNGVREASLAIFNNVTAAIRIFILDARIGFETLKNLAGAGTAGVLQELRSQRRAIEENGLSIADAFRRGFDEINDIEIELPDATEPAFDAGEMAGEALGDGIKEGIKGKQGEVQQEVIDLFGSIEGELSRLQAILENQVAVGDLVGGTQTVARIRELSREFNVITSALDAISTAAPIEELPQLERIDNFSSEVDQAFKTFEDATARLDELEVSDPNVRRGSFLQRLLGLDDEGLEQLRVSLSTALEQTQAFISSILEAEEERTNLQIGVQEDRVTKATQLAEKGNAELLQAEEERLDELQNQRARAVQRQRQLAAVEIAINQALAISDTIRNIASNPFLAAIQISALIAGVASAGVAINSAFSDLPTFNLGTELVGSDKRFKRSSSDREGFIARFNGYERIIPENINKKLAGFPNKKLPDAVAAYKAFGRSPFTGFTDKSQGVDLGAKMDRIGDAVENMKVRVKLDRKGFEINQQSYRNRAIRRKKIIS